MRPYMSMKLTKGFPLSLRKNVYDSLQNGHRHLERIFSRWDLGLRRVRPESRLLPISCAHSVGTDQTPHGCKKIVQNSVTSKVSVDKQQLRGGEVAVARNQHDRNMGR